MKKLEIIIKPEKLDDLKQILEENQANGIMITNIMGYGAQQAIKEGRSVPRFYYNSPHFPVFFRVFYLYSTQIRLSMILSYE